MWLGTRYDNDSCEQACSLFPRGSLAKREDKQAYKAAACDECSNSQICTVWRREKLLGGLDWQLDEIRKTFTVELSEILKDEFSEWLKGGATGIPDRRTLFAKLQRCKTAVQI